ncbi:hypothetical protein CD144_07160 [Staphylococcus equorum subsp. linens]|uniref:hypothetical protein n=1 Tax=Staphylococcus equorum TaxID=246432 RepID=UPI000CD0ED8D|nr:hypothetical protein [Staphylococcus equorum]PNZ07353.1 hypothetical protein CD144_07160 [Staphylococcus equorum subsp. linens]QQT16811.1 hypothetical protein I6J07_07800 [Staphylococcus equorum]
MDKNTLSFSKLTDTKSNFEEILKVLDSKIGEISTEEPYFIELSLKRNFEELTDVKQIEIANSKYNYKVYKYYKENINKGFEQDVNRETRVSDIEMYIVVFSNKTTTQYLISKSVNDSKGKTILRQLMNYESSGEIETNKISILSDKDFYLWLFYSVLNDKNSDEDITIVSIEGYRGSDRETLTHVTGSGSELLNLLSTLTFIFESDNINRIKLKVLYDSHYVVLHLHNNGNVKIHFSEYQGDYDELAKGDEIANITLMSMLLILPKISSIYSQDEWHKDKFKKDIGDNVIERVKGMTTDLES